MPRPKQPPLSDSEKEMKRARNNLLLITNRLESAYNFKTIKTWEDVWKHQGIEDVNGRQTGALTFPELKQYIFKLREELEQQLKEKYANLQQPFKILPDTPSSTSGKEVSTSSSIPELQQKSIETGEAINNKDAIHVPEGTTNLPQTVVDRPTEVKEQVLQKVEPQQPSVKETGKDKQELGLTAKNDYGWVKSPQESKELYNYWFQKKMIAEACDKIFEKHFSGLLILAPTGCGKTFVVAGIARRALDREWHEGKTMSHVPYLYVTKATVVEQTNRVMKRFYGIAPNVDFDVVNIEQLRSTKGKYWIKTETKVVNGEEVETVSWKKGLHPSILWLDESQGAKNKGSKQSKIVYTYNDLPPQMSCLVCISATPFARVVEAQAWAVSTRRCIDHLGFPKGTRLNNLNWPTYAAIIASPASPNDYNQAAIERLMEDLKDYVVRGTGIKPQFNAINGVKIVDFRTPEMRKYYQEAEERLMKELAEMEKALKEGIDIDSYRFVILQRYCIAAEFCHADHFAYDMDQCVRKGKAAVCGCKQKGTIIEVVRLLIEKYGWKRSDISLVWGGGQTQLTKKQKQVEAIKKKADKLKAMGMDVQEMLETLDLDKVEERKIIKYPEEWRLGMQTPEDRQEEIDRFQSGKSLFCCFTFKAGGVGLSLHHSDELTKQKCRRKESGYAVEEDIPLISVRPRELFGALTYNAIEMVQVLGRCPRLTSLSPTVQNIYCYAGTIEVDMGHIVSQKLRCIKSVVKMREDWMDVIVFGAKGVTERTKAVQDALRSTENVESDEEGTMLGDEEGEDDNGE